jgi:LmbE family N-acetylglucosaminyl deacetylase
MIKILAIGAHADDVEFGCGGFLWQQKLLGNSVDILILRNELAKKPSFSRSSAEYKQDILDAETYWGSNFIQYQDCEIHAGRPTLTHDGYSVKFVDNIIHQYDLILCHNPYEHHQDHTTVHKIVKSASRKYQGKVMCYESPLYINSTEFIPTIFVDISKTFHNKIELIKCYKSYITPDHIKMVTALAELRSTKIKNCKFAEAYSLMQDIVT